MPSIFDILLGRNAGPTTALPGTPPIAPPGPFTTASPSILDAYNDKGAAARDTLMGLSQGLLAAGGPSQVPIDMFSALGKGISGGLSARDAGEDKTLKRALIGAQVATAQDKIQQRRALSKLLLEGGAGTATPAVTPPTDPTNPAAVAGIPGAGPSSPTTPTAWDPHYHQASTSTGLSVDLLKAKDAVESGGNANAVSPAGAAGPAQLMPGTAKDLGVSNPKDPAQAIPAGARYLAEQYAKYKDVDKALAAYNWGPANVDKWIAAGANPALLPAETQKYIADIKARLPPNPTFGGTPNVGSLGNNPGNNLENPGNPGNGAPVQLAQAGGGAVPLPAAPTAPAPGVPAAPNIRQVIQNLKPAERQLLSTMDPEAVTKFLLDRTSPNHQVVMDTKTGGVVFVDKTDPGIGTRYQPVDAAKLAIEMQNAESQRRQAAAREQANTIRQANEPLQPPTVPGGAPTPTPGFAEQKGAVAGAEAGAKVAPALVQHQGELVIKDLQQAQTGAEHARIGIANLNRLGSLLGQVDTNKFAGTTLEFKAAAKAAGVDLDALGVGDNVGVGQAAKALSQQLALQLRDPSGGGGMPGSLSNDDRQFLTTMVPAITNDPNANKLMIDWQKKLHQRTIEIGKIVNDYGRSPEFLKDPTGVYAKVREYADKNPLFDPEKDAPKPSASSGGALPMPPLSAIDAEIERRRKLGVR